MEQRERGIIFSSCLSKHQSEDGTARIHEIHIDDEDIEETKDRLLKDSFFDGSPWKYNIIRE